MGREAPLSPPGEGERRDTSSGKYEGTCARTLPAANGADGSENGPARRIRKLCAGVPAYAGNCQTARASAHANFRRTRRTPRPREPRVARFASRRPLRSLGRWASRRALRSASPASLARGHSLGDKPEARRGVVAWGTSQRRGRSLGYKPEATSRLRLTQTGRSTAGTARYGAGRESGLARSQTC